MNRKHRLYYAAALTVSLALVFGTIPKAIAQFTTNNSDPVHITVSVIPFAALEFIDTPHLHLNVPPPGSTVPSAGVRFLVTGNAYASIQAEPDEFVQIPSEGDQWLGKAVLNQGEIGYNIELRFPRFGVSGSLPQISNLPGFEPGPAVSATPVNMPLTGGVREGVIHMESSHEWTPDGALPLPGIYVGLITLTVSADPI